MSPTPERSDGRVFDTENNPTMQGTNTTLQEERWRVWLRVFMFVAALLLLASVSATGGQDTF